MSDGLVDYLRELCEPLGPVAFKKMFGGCALMSDGRMFGLVADDALYFKVDAETSPAYEARGLPRFSYTTKDGRRTVMSYARAPEDVFDDVEVFRDWALRAIAAAARSAATPRKPRRRKTVDKSV